jgi:hypothetical protein
LSRMIFPCSSPSSSSSSSSFIVSMTSSLGTAKPHHDEERSTNPKSWKPKTHRNFSQKKSFQPVCLLYFPRISCKITTSTLGMIQNPPPRIKGRSGRGGKKNTTTTCICEWIPSRKNFSTTMETLFLCS